MVHVCLPESAPIYHSQRCIEHCYSMHGTANPIADVVGVKDAATSAVLFAASDVVVENLTRLRAYGVVAVLRRRAVTAP